MRRKKNYSLSSFSRRPYEYLALAMLAEAVRYGDEEFLGSDLCGSICQYFERRTPEPSEEALRIRELALTCGQNEMMETLNLSRQTVAFFRVMYTPYRENERDKIGRRSKGLKR